VSAMGLLVTLEGGPGSGTAEQALLLRQSLDGEGVPADFVQPGGEDAWLVPDGQRAPEWPPASRVAPFLFAVTHLADTWHHLAAPGVAAGSIVILDRYRTTLLAHARARKLDAEWAAATVAVLRPADVAIYLRSDPVRQLDRLLRAGQALRGWQVGIDVGAARGTGFAGAFRAYQSTVSRQFDALAGPGRLLVLDGDCDPAVLQRQIHDAVITALEAVG